MLLTMMGKLSEREIILAATIFDKLDSNSDGENRGNKDKLFAENFHQIYFLLLLWMS